MRRFLLLLTMTTVLGACRDKSVARVTKHHGDLMHDTASSQQKWEAAPDGTKLSLGDALKTGASSEATVHLTRGGTLKLPPDTTIRFLASKPGAEDPKLAVETGEASVEAEGGEVVIETSIGTAHIESGAEVKIGASRIEVSVGSARLDTPDGGIALAPGKPFDVALGGAIVEKEAVADAGVDAGRPPPTASGITLDVQSKGVRKQAKGSTAWTPLPEGTAELAPGDTIDAPNGADLSRGAQHAHMTGKFVVGDEGGALARATSGKAELDATTDEIRLDVPGGSIVAKPGKSHVTAELGTTTKIAVTSGEGEVRGAVTETIRAGESAVLSAKGAVTVSGRGAAVADFSMKAGDSLVIRDGRPPTALGIDFSAVCPGAAIVTRDEANQVRGDKKANVLMPPGAHPYAIRCIGADGIEAKPVSTGTVTVIPDSARADLPRVAPSSVVDTDGRKYTILYQNLLPSIVVRWMDAPKEKGFSLLVDGRKQNAETARATLKAGTLGEGTHTLKFQTADGSKSSADTTVVVKFDNAAPAAQIREPADGSFGPTDSVKVSGLVSEGWSVSIAGQPVALDEQQRFSTTATPSPGENAIVLRLSHPQRGIVYYVRHAHP